MCHAEFCIGLGLRVLRHAYSAYAQHLWSTGLKMLVLTFVQMMCGQPKVCGTSAKGRRIGGKVWSWDRSALRRASSATGLWSCIMWEQGGMKFQVASMMRSVDISFVWLGSIFTYWQEKLPEIRERLPKSFFVCYFPWKGLRIPMVS